MTATTQSNLGALVWRFINFTTTPGVGPGTHLRTNLTGLIEAMTETIQEIISRVSKAQPEIFLQNHEGYYRHSDISTLLREIARLRSSVNPWDIYEDWEHLVGNEVGSEFLDIPAKIRTEIFSETMTVEESVAASRAWLAGHRD